MNMYMVRWEVMGGCWFFGGLAWPAQMAKWDSFEDVRIDGDPCIVLSVLSINSSQFCRFGSEWWSGFENAVKIWRLVNKFVTLGWDCVTRRLNILNINRGLERWLTTTTISHHFTAEILNRTSPIISFCALVVIMLRMLHKISFIWRPINQILILTTGFSCQHHTYVCS